MRYCYVVFHIFYDMNLNEEVSIIDSAYESKDDAIQYCDEMNRTSQDSYYIEVAEYHETGGQQSGTDNDNVNLMIRLIKEIEWYYQNRKSHILPIVYEDMLKDAVHYASQNMWENASVWLNGLRKAREETE